jgi:hypothetical protein
MSNIDIGLAVLPVLWHKTLYGGKSAFFRVRLLGVISAHCRLAARLHDTRISQQMDWLWQVPVMARSVNRRPLAMPPPPHAFHWIRPLLSSNLTHGIY